MQSTLDIYSTHWAFCCLYSLEVLSHDEQNISVKIKGVPLQYTNALRRICLNGVPVFAIDTIDVITNTSVLADEGIAQNPSQSITGIIHEKLRDYGIHDIEFVCGFDVGENKVGKKINEAIYEKPNMVNWIPKESMPKTDALVYEGPAHDGVGIWVENKVNPIKSGKN